MRTLYLDLETYCPIDIKKGVYRYSEEAEIMLAAYAVDDGISNVLDCTVPGNGIEYLINFLFDGKTVICAHNSNFDRIMVEHAGTAFQGLKWRDTMVRALAHGLPGGLDLLSQIFKLPVDQAKDKEGKKLVHFFCKPQKDGKRNTRLTHPAEWERFKNYAKLDVEAMRALDKKIPSWNDTETERRYWAIDQQINDRGFRVDLDLAESAIAAVDAEKKILDKRAHELTSGSIGSATQRDKLLTHILEIHGVDLPDMQAGTLKRRLEDPDLPEPVKELIALRLESSVTSTAKYKALKSSVCSDGRLRGTLQFCGANRTGRWSGRIFQPQNLPRPKFKAAEIEIGIKAIKAGAADLIYKSVSDMASSAIRGLIVAPPKKKLVVSDLSAIEGRKLAWLAGEEWKIRAYEEYDTNGGYDMYVLTYARTFGISPDEVTKKQRQMGKVLELALGYGGGAGAFFTFANVYKVNLEDLTAAEIPSDIAEEAESFWQYCVEQKKTLGLSHEVFVACDSIKRMWRRANPRIVQFWRDLEDACYGAIAFGRETTLRRGMVVDKKGTWMRIKLPSGRYLCYAGARIENKKIKYLGINQYSRKWCHLTTYGCKTAEHVTQASSRDTHAHGLPLAEEAGYKCVLLAHDELVTETPDTSEYSGAGLSKLIATVPFWAKGLPLAAKGFEGYRYKKED